MTFRLVALMSVVLLLSLAAFGLLMGRYQDEVMEEVARTASAASRATLESLEFGDIKVSAGGLHWQDDVRFPARESIDGATADGQGDGLHVRRAIIIRGEVDPHGGTFEEVNQFVTADTAPFGSFVSHLECRVEDTPETCERLRSLAREFGEGSTGEMRAEFFINLEGVRAEAEPTANVVMLRIPTFVSAKETHGPHTTLRKQVTGATAADAQELLLERHDEFRLPIAVDDYQDLFASLRSKSLFLFLGVFLVGTVLSTGLASRFTRPIRRLDAGIRRLSDGDLDVKVDVEGHDEIARLGEAFNHMTGKLRANRDRSREMVRREKLSALGGLAAGVAHDVRNPLHSIGLTLQHLGDTCRPEERARAEEFDRGIEIIRGQIRRLDDLVGNFLQFSRSEQRERQAVDLALLLGETANLIRKEAEWRGIRVEMDLLPTVPPVSANAEGLRASLLNLVMNSFHAMPEGGTLTLRLAVDHENLVVEVADDGAGIPAEDLEKVFEFAYTTREGGNGLGLAMVHECVVEEHGGRVTLDSRAGAGTTVRLELPIRTHDPEEV